MASADITTNPGRQGKDESTNRDSSMAYHSNGTIGSDSVSQPTRRKVLLASHLNRLKGEQPSRSQGKSAQAYFAKLLAINSHMGHGSSTSTIWAEQAEYIGTQVADDIKRFTRSLVTSQSGPRSKRHSAIVALSDTLAFYTTEIHGSEIPGLDKNRVSADYVTLISDAKVVGDDGNFGEKCLNELFDYIVDREPWRRGVSSHDTCREPPADDTTRPSDYPWSSGRFNQTPKMDRDTFIRTLQG